MNRLFIHQVLCADDRYAFLVHDPRNAMTAVVDPPEVEPIARAVASLRWRPTHILNTHAHVDRAHESVSLEVQLALKEKWQCSIVGPKTDRDRIPAIELAVAEGDRFQLGGAYATVLEVPRHNRGHIAYHFPDDRILFAGDTLEVLGCGRLFGGTARGMWASLSKLMTLPDETRIFCAHEYAQANARFALTVDPGNVALQKRAADIDRLRAARVATVPTTLALEKATNPFLRVANTELQAALGMRGADPVEVFAEIRRRKDSFSQQYEREGT